MQEWLRNQEWSEELWVAVWVAAVLAVSIVAWGYDKYLKH
jgi:hypothetical protein